MHSSQPTPPSRPRFSRSRCQHPHATTRSSSPTRSCRHLPPHPLLDLSLGEPLFCPCTHSLGSCCSSRLRRGRRARGAAWWPARGAPSREPRPPGHAQFVPAALGGVQIWRSDPMETEQVVLPLPPFP
ncbi:hypothetical protein VPH35_030735 [Triticum aestivum]